MLRTYLALASGLLLSAPAASARGEPAPAALSVVREGVRISVRSVAQRESHILAAGSSRSETTRSVTLAFELCLLDGDSEALHGLASLRSRDDRGREITAPDLRRRPGSGAPTGEWRAEATFSGYTPGARFLESVEGEVVLHRPAAHGSEVPERRIPFRFGRIPLPLAPQEGTTPPGTASGLLLSLPTGLARDGVLTLGISRRQGDGWGAFRWLTLETTGSGEAQMERLGPGVYRLRASFRPRDPRGSLAGAVALKPASVTVPRGRAARVLLSR